MKWWTLSLSLFVAPSAGAGLNDLWELPALDLGPGDLIGAAAASLPEYSGAEERRAATLPLLKASHGDTLYFHVSRFGAWLHSTENKYLRLGILAQGRRGRDEGDGPLLAGTAARDSSIEGGVNASFRLPVGRLELGYVTDLSGSSGGSAAYAEYRVPMYVRAGQWLVLANVDLEWLSSDVADYLYGVRPTEALPGRPAYTAGSTVNVRMGITARWWATERWNVVGGLSIHNLGGEATDSPIVPEDANAVLFAAVARVF